jgi:integrase/recombinase XerD
MVTSDFDKNSLDRLSPENAAIIQSLIQQMNGGAGLSNGRRLSKPADGMTHWEAKLRQERYSKQTIKMYRYYIGRYLKDNPTPSKLDVQSYLADQLEGGTSPSAVENMRKAFHSLFSFLYEEGLWREDPTEKIRRVKVSYGNRSCPTPDDVQKVIEVGCHRRDDEDKMVTMIRLLSTTGLRLGEACGLRKDGIDWELLELRIVGKGDKFRVVPLLPFTAELLKEYMARHPSDSPYVFPGEGAGGHAQIYNFEKTLRRACKRAGVKPFSPHGLRHFYATEMLKKGAKLEVVGRILGHASIGITADIYRHVRTGEMHEEHLKFAPV